jgi:shikimate kinase
MRRPGKRPLLQTDNPRTTLETLMEQRKPLYAKADVIVDTSNSSKNITRDWVIEALTNHLPDEIITNE